VTAPLAGIKAVEFAEHAFVPAAAAVLAEWGADVIKVERRTGDHLRHLPIRTPDGFDYLFQLFNRNKRGIALDVERPEGREIFHALVRWCDVYVTNHLPRVQRRLGDRPADIFAVNPKVVYARGSGQGQRGPDAERGGNDNVAYWSRAGVGYMLSDPASAEIIPQRAAIGDAPSGIALAAGILAGLLHVSRTGEGIEVNASLLNTGLWTLGPDIALASATGIEPERRSAAAGSLAGPLSRHYRTRDGRRLALSMTNEERYWPMACRALGLDDLVERSPDVASRQRDQLALIDRFRTEIAELDAADLDLRLRAEDCVYAFVNNPVEVLDDSAAIANGYLVAHPDHPDLRLAAIPAQFDDDLPAMRRGAPRIGEHDVEILTELGYRPDHIDELIADGVIGPLDPHPL
jgi:crotonobetainyl-CoA:carnitine CoA-transferase CaiB-like acyl-CoA transferase